MQQSLFGAAVVPAAVEVAETGLETPLVEAVFTVLDLETTGLSPKRNAITEITAIQYKNGVEQGKYSTLVKPAEPISAEVEALTGITNAMVQQAPPLVTVLPELCAFVGQAPIVVGHNVAFDIGFLQEKLAQNGLSSLANRFDLMRALCTKALAVKAMPGLPSYEGIVVATQCGVVNPNPHRAENDVRMSAGILFALIERIRQQGGALHTVQDLLTYQGAL